MSVLLSILLAFSIGSLEAAANCQNMINATTLQTCEETAESFIKNTGRVPAISNPITLKDANNEPVAIVFDISSNGYIIVNIDDMSIAELSFDSANPFTEYANAIYNGPLEYYYSENGVIKKIRNNVIVNSSALNYYSNRNTITQSENSANYFSYPASLNIVVEKYLTGTLQTWYIGGGNCGSIAAAICMRYYYDYVSTNYVASNNTSMNSLISTMQDFVGTGGTSYSSMVSGLNSYFNARNISNTALRNTTFSFSRVKQSIRANRPIIVGTSGHETYGNHWVIAHGYYESRVDGNYLIVNNGWGSNNIWIESNTTTLDGSIYFAS